MLDAGLITISEAERENRDRFNRTTEEPSYITESPASSSVGQETRDYDFFYDPQKDAQGGIIAPTPSGVDKPDRPSLLTRGVASVADAYDTLTGDDVRPPVAAQQEVAQFDKEFAEFERKITGVVSRGF